MSLLLEALKRAEKAKEEAQRRAAESAPTAESRRVLTKDHLPDIAQPLEIVSDEPGRTVRSPDSEALAQPRGAGPASDPSRAETANAAQSSSAQRERATARRVFEAKLREPDPRRPFFITLAVLGLCAVSIVAYFWYQLRPPAPLAIANPSQPIGERMRALAEAAAPAADPVAPMRPIRGMPTGGKATTGEARMTPPPDAKARTSARARQQPAQPRTARVSPQVRRAPAAESAAVASEDSSTLNARRSAPAQGIHPQVEAGYAAYQAGDLARARDAYRRALADEPMNRDALLGLAAVETRLRKPAAAEALYARVLQRDPRDVHARAGLLGLRGAQQDPVSAESQLKNLLATDPAATELQYALGNQYAKQERWSDAQQAYFKAFTAEPDNPDYAYNLAVSLDHLHKPGLALEYYRRALTLAGPRSAGFNRAAVERRVQDLAR